MQTRALSASHPVYHGAPPARSTTAPEATPQDRVTLAGGQAGFPEVDRQAEARGDVTRLPGWMQAVCLGLVGAIGFGAVAGCSPRPPSTSTSTTQSSQELQQLKQAFADVEQQIKQAESQGGDAKAQATEHTRQLAEAVKEYANKTGRSAQGVAEDLKQVMRDHPVATLTAVYALGVGAGIGLEKLGLSEKLGDGLGAIVQAAKDHPFITTVVVTAAAGTVAYLIYDAVSQPDIPPVPDTPEARKLGEAFAAAEEKALNAEGDGMKEAREIDRTLKERIREYAEATGRTASEVGEEIKGFYYQHPGASAAIVLAAGVGTGVVLERAGVPDHVAQAVQSAFEAGKGGLAGVARAAKEHPILATAIGVGIAAGAGYLIYQWATAPSGS